MITQRWPIISIFFSWHRCRNGLNLLQDARTQIIARGQPWDKTQRSNPSNTISVFVTALALKDRTQDKQSKIDGIYRSPVGLLGSRPRRSQGMISPGYFGSLKYPHGSDSFQFSENLTWSAKKTTLLSISKWIFIWGFLQVHRSLLSIEIASMCTSLYSIM